MLSIKAIAGLLGAVLVAVVVAACGSSSSSPSSTSASSGLETGGYKSPLTESLTSGKKGGKLVVLQETEFEHLDPGLSYYNLDYPVVFATQRPLYSYKPNQEARIDARPGVRSAGNRRRQQDRHGSPQGRHQVQPAGEPRSHLGRRQVRLRTG